MTSLEVIALTGLPSIEAGDDLAELVRRRSVERGRARAKDVLVMAQKIVSKAEARVVDLATVNRPPGA